MKFRLYHNEWRTEETLDNEIVDSGDGFASFNFRGFKGKYELKLMDGKNEIKTWRRNLKTDSNWILSMD